MQIAYHDPILSFKLTLEITSMYQARGITVDGFAGAGGASLALEGVYGAPGPDVAINHNATAIAVHEANHPLTIHYHADIREVDPRTATEGQPVHAFHASPDCTYFSRASNKPIDRKGEAVRMLAWETIKWLDLPESERPNLFTLENVPEFEDWGPLDAERRPIRDGSMFDAYVEAIRARGYNVEWRTLQACDYGAPTSRERLYMVARKGAAPVHWPQATHGPGRAPYRTAAEIIDWTIPCPSIFESAKTIKRKHGVRVRRPLAAKSLERIATGVWRHVINTDDPCILGEGPTVEGHPTLAAAFLARHWEGMASKDLREPFPTITTKGCQDQPVRVLLAKRGVFKHRECRAFLAKYYGTGGPKSANEPVDTITTKDRFAVVQVWGQDYQIIDIGTRMLTTRELYRVQGFPEDYDFSAATTDKARKRLVGNSVCPDVLRAIYEAQEAA